MITTTNINAMLGFPFNLSGDYTPTGKFYLGLSTSPIRDNGSGMDEPHESCGYRRFEIDNDNSSWKIENGVVSNLNQFEFPELIANAGTATHWFLSRTEDGDAEFFGKFTYERPLAIHSVIFVNPGDLRIILENVRDDEDFDIYVRPSVGGVAQANMQRALYGETVDLLALPSERYRFIQWNPNTLLEGIEKNQPSTSFTMPAEDVEIDVLFKKEHDINVSATQGGEAEADLDVAIEGETVSLTAVSIDDNAYGFVQWDTQNALSGLDASNPDAAFVMPDEDVTVSAVFDVKYGISVIATAGGYANANGVATSLAGKVITLTATPTEGYRFSAWQTTNTLPGLIAGNATTTFTMPAEAVEVTAVFVAE